MNALRTSLTELHQKKERLIKMSELFASLTDSTRSVDELNLRHEAQVRLQVTLVQQIQVNHEKNIALEREIHLLETQLSLLKKIQSFEATRQQLQDGESCPLCGAKEHPFAEGNIPLPDETTVLLNQARSELKITSHTLSDLKIKQAEILKDLEQSALLKEELAGKISTLNDQLNQGRLEFGISSNLGWPLAQQDNADNVNATSIALMAAELLEKEIATLRASFDKTNEAAIQSERKTQIAVHQKEIANQNVEHAKKAADALSIEIQQAMCELVHEMVPYGIHNLTNDALADLTARRDQWLLRQKKKLELEQGILSLDRDIQHQRQQISTSETALQKQQALFGLLERELNDLAQQRGELYGDKDPDHEEACLSKAIEAADKQLDVARERSNHSSQELARTKHRIEELERLIDLRCARLNQAEDAFQVRLSQSGFATEASYLASCLPEKERKKRMHQASQLDIEQTELEAKRRDTTALLETERHKNITVQTIEELKLELPRLVQIHRELQHEIGGIRHKLQDNDGLRLKQQDRVTAIENQKNECSRWNILHELIGSVDGKKYRNFAQGLTFEMMIGHANRQLLKMTDRYLLSRDESQPLELNVVDNYQAGEVRSTKNLSGGESFIVSLCLALGLSQMSSQNVRVDSLFLDEGFGTLDDEALDTALETLAGLQQDGKLIGMISHVPALKERISTQIRITPKTGGRSVISGFGCRLVDNA